MVAEAWLTRAQKRVAMACWQARPTDGFVAAGSWGTVGLTASLGGPMARAIWKGSISFGLVNVPVAMYAAVSEQDLHFHLIHSKDDSPIGYQKVCKEEDKPVPDDEIARAYELEDGSYVVLEDSDFEAAKADGYHAITVLDFVDRSEIDPIYFERTFYLGPQDDGAASHVYQLLAEAMEGSGLAAICSYLFHNREQLGCLRVREGVLLLEKMHFADEIRAPDDARPGRRQKLKRDELEAARRLIDRMTRKFDLEKYEDSYRRSLLKVIRRKAKGEKITVDEPEQRSEAPDLLEALQASLKESKRGSKRTSKKGGSRGKAGTPKSRRRAKASARR
jgi:DNA end-binding protein Ku